MAPTSPSISSPARIFALTRIEWRIGRRNPVFRFALVVALIFGLSIGGEHGRGVALSAYSTAEAACQYLGFAAIVWMSLAAVRETTLRTDILVFSKPQPGEYLALTKFLGSYLQLLAILLALFLGSIISRTLSGGLLGLQAYLPQFARAAAVLLFAASASYMLALLFDSALAGITVGLYWLLTAAGKAFLGKYYFPAYTQNLGAYVALSLALLLATLHFYRRARRGSQPTAPWVRIGAPILALLAAWQFNQIIQQGHDPEVRTSPIMERMAEQDTNLNSRAAGFQLPDQNGKLTGLADYPGKILVIALWSPRDPDSVLLLDQLNQIHATLAKQGVQPIAITVCEDTGASQTFAQGEQLTYPVLTDWGAYNAPRGTDLSPIASAYRATTLPTVFITDRRRNIRAMLSGIGSYDGDGLNQAIQERLTEEPK